MQFTEFEYKKPLSERLFCCLTGRLRQLVRLCAFTALAWVLMPGLVLAQISSQPHSHNDYRHPLPLFGALDCGCRSIEVDLYLKGERLVVSHLPLLLGTKPDLEALYLAPLQQRIQENGGTVWPEDSTQLTLYLDFKTQGATYAAVRSAIARYPGMFQTWQSQDSTWGPVRLLIDGHGEELLADSVRWAEVQRPMGSTAAPLPPGVQTWANASWKRHFKWRGRGPMPDAEASKLAAMVAEAHAQGYQVRFYATGDRPAIWEALIAAGADWINVDDCAQFRLFLAKEIP